MHNVVFTADDLGLGPRENEGIHQALEAGLVREVSLLATCAGFEEGLGIARRFRHRVGVGLHFSLTEGRSLTGPIRGVTDPRGAFHSLPRVLCNARLGRVDRDAVDRELLTQWELLRSCGLTLSHLDGHQHVHAFPVVRDVVVSRFGGGALPIRVPDEIAGLGRRRSRPRVRVIRRLAVGLAARLARRRGRSPLAFTGLNLHRHPRYRHLLRETLAGLQGDLEVMVHPRGASRRDPNASAELHALTCPASLGSLRAMGVRSCRHGDLS